MKLLPMTVLAASLVVTGAFADTNAGISGAETSAATSQAMTKQDKLSYTIGVDLGSNFKRQGVEINPKMFLRGFMDGQKGGAMLMDKKQMISTLQGFQKELMAKREAKFKKAASANKEAGDAFLADNKTKSGVVTLPSGLQYKIISKGEGQSPSLSDEVTVKYTGRLISGKVFDSTDRIGRPATFKVNEVIPGWTEALQIMKPGSVWEVYVPAKLAYGERGAGGPIGPNETLIFNIQLLSVKGEGNKPSSAHKVKKSKHAA